MSHFTVLVPADDEEQLDRILLPFHEYECTGIEEYTQMIPIDMERWRGYYDRYLDKYDDGEAMMSFDEYMDDAGIEMFNGEWCQKTNPNAKWDWWQIGGRWTGSLALKRPVHEIENAGSGRPGLLTDPNFDDTYADYAPSGEIDWERMAEDWRARERNWYYSRQDVYELAKNWREDAPEELIERSMSEWNDKDSPKFNLRRDAFGNDINLHHMYTYAERLQRERFAEGDKSAELFFDNWDAIKKSLQTKEEFEATLNIPDAATYAYIDLDGNWHQRAEMGWWGVSDKTKATDNYDENWWNFVNSLPPDKVVYLIDCHI